MAPSGFTVIAVALDDDAAVVRPWTEGITFPVLLDRQHALTEAYAISNVPTVVWIDEDDRIVRPNGVAHGSNTFQEFTGVDAAVHMDLLRDWVRTGRAPIGRDEARAAVGDLSGDEVDARLHFRLAAHARRHGDEAAARRHFDEAVRLAPHDWTIRRAAMPLTGRDPFGPEFFAMWGEWQQAGSPYHGLPAAPAASS